MHSDNGSGSGKHPSVRDEGEVLLRSDESSGHSSCGKSELQEEIRDNVENTTAHAPSNSSDGTSDEHFQVDPIIIPKPTRHNLSPRSEALTGSKVEEETDGIGSGAFELEEMFGSFCSTSHISVVTHESFVQTVSPTKSPPIQAMEKPRGYDPLSIPASVSTHFASIDWSIASNESLFSIQIGSCSFSRDHIVKLGGDAYAHKESGSSRDLDFSEWCRSGELNSPTELVRLRQSSPSKKAGDHKLRDLDLGSAQVFEKTKVNGHDKTISNHQGGTNPDEAYSHCDENKTNGGVSCAFRIKETSQPCLFPNCSSAFCSCKDYGRPRYLCQSFCMPSSCCLWLGCSSSCCSCSSCRYICPGCCIQPTSPSCSKCHGPKI